MDPETVLCDLRQRGYSARDILECLLPYIRDGCLDAYVEDDVFTEVDVRYDDDVVREKVDSFKGHETRTFVDIQVHSRKTLRVVHGKDVEVIVGCATPRTNPTRRLLVDEYNRICGEGRPWYDERDSVCDSFKDADGYVLKDGQVMYEYEIYATKATGGSIRSGIYRSHAYSPTQRKLIETGEVL